MNKMEDNSGMPQESYNSILSRMNKRENIKVLYGLLFFAVVVVAVVTTPILLRASQTLSQYADTTNLNACGNPGGFCETFDGDPASPQPLGGIAGKNIFPHWDFQVHSRDTDTWGTLETQTDVMHGVDCSAPPATHTNNTYEGAIFNCKNHVMTAMLAEGYGLIALTPDQMADFSNQPSVISWQMSTDRMSDRDWPDVWVTPFSQNLTLPFDIGDVDLQGTPKTAVHINASDSQNAWLASTISNYNETMLNDQYSTPSMSDGITAGTNQDAVRQTFVLTISSTHIKLERLASATATAVVYVDRDVPNIGFTQGVVQFAHHIYNPTKSDGCGSVCMPATWHWDQISIYPSLPFTMIHADKRKISNSGEIVTFDSPAPANSFLRFSGIGKISISTNGGSTWSVAPKQAFLSHYEHMSPYFVPIPEGTQQVKFNFAADNWYDCNTYGCQATDFSIWSTTAPNGSSLTPTPTSTSTNPTSTVAPTPTLIPTATSTPIPPTPTPTAASTGGTSVNVGNTTIGSTYDSSDSNYMNGIKVKIGTKNGVAKSISVYIPSPVSAAPNNQFQVAIYANNSGRPGKLVAQSATGTLVANSWNTLPISANLTAGTVYWLMYNTNGASSSDNNMKLTLSSTKNAGAWAGPQGFGSWPSTYPTSNLGNWAYSMYLTYTQ